MADLLTADQGSFSDVNPFGSDYKMSLDALRIALASKKELKVSKDQIITFTINGESVLYESSRVLRTHDTMADAANMSVNIDANWDILTKIRPYGFEEVEVHLDSEKIFQGFLYNLDNTIEEKSRVVNLECFSGTIDLVDSCPDGPPYTFKDKNFTKIAKTLTKNFDVKIIDKALSQYKFKRVTIAPTEKIGAFLGKLAKQIGVLLSSDVNGNLEIKNSNKIGIHSASITNEQVIVPKITMSWKGRSRFSKFVSLGKRPKKNVKETTEDKNVPRNRIFSYKADEKDKGIKKETSTAWKKNMSIAESLQINLPVIGFYDDLGLRWTEGNLITIEFNELWLTSGMKFMIRSVEFNDTSKEKVATLGLVLPETYTDKEIVEPWGEQALKMSLYDLRDILEGKF